MVVDDMLCSPAATLPINVPLPQQLRHSRFIARHWLSLLGTALFALLLALSLLAPLLPLADPTAIDLRVGLTPPSWAHPLGTDQLGRDLLSRIIWAGRTSLLLTVLVLLASLFIGLIVGVVAGYVGGVLDDALMRLTDAALALPTLLLALALLGAWGTNLWALTLALVAGHWAPYARLVRSQVQSLRTSGYVLASEAVGARPTATLRRHVLPGVLGAVVVQGSLDVGAVLLTIGGLSFLGLGVQPPTPEWGAMLVEARPFLTDAPQLVLAPGTALFVAVFGCNALGELLAQALRPRHLA